MPITVIVRSAAGDENRLTFDGTQRIVIGRGASCDVRLPDPSVSHRHACLRAQGAEFVLVDEGSMNGTFVGGVRIAARTSRLVRSGDLVRAGRIWLELRLDQSPITRDVAAATRELALALVSQAMARAGADATMRIQVVEGRDQGATLPLVAEDHVYVIGRAAECDLPLSDADASREHAQVSRRGSAVSVRDLGAKNGTWIGGVRLPPGGEATWRPVQMMRLGRTVLALVEPLGDLLAEIESAPDEPLPADAPVAPPPAAAPPATAEVQSPNPAGTDVAPTAAPLASVPAAGDGAGDDKGRRPRAVWSATDIVVVTAALGVLALSIAGLVWLLRG
jgi:pSer/pThr/pTyr-binding forkhead associated (FHA) protein